jgi:hypothetical protein
VPNGPLPLLWYEFGGGPEPTLPDAQQLLAQFAVFQGLEPPSLPQGRVRGVLIETDDGQLVTLPIGQPGRNV